MDGRRVGKATAAEGVCVEKVALFPRELDAAASLLDQKGVLSQSVSKRMQRKHWRPAPMRGEVEGGGGGYYVILGQTPDELSRHVGHCWIFGSAWCVIATLWHCV